MKQAFKEHCNRSALIRMVEARDEEIANCRKQIADLKQHICQSADFKINIAKAKNTLHIE